MSSLNKNTKHHKKKVTQRIFLKKELYVLVKVKCLSDLHSSQSTSVSIFRTPYYKMKNPTMRKKLNKNTILPQEWVNLHVSELQWDNTLFQGKDWITLILKRKRQTQKLYAGTFFSHHYQNCHQHHKIMIINPHLWKIHMLFCCVLWLRWQLGLVQNFVEEIVINNR